MRKTTLGRQFKALNKKEMTRPYMRKMTLGHK